jgi:tryptophan-rich sensory protein
MADVQANAAVAQPNTGGGAPAAKPESAKGGTRMSIRLLVMIPLLPPALWNFFTTYRGLTDFFDVPRNPSLNPGQFAFGVIVAVIVLGFVMASHLILNWDQYDPPVLFLKAACVVCILVNVAALWEGTKRVIQFEDDDPGKGFALALVVALIVASTVLLSKLLLDDKSG